MISLAQGATLSVPVAALCDQTHTFAGRPWLSWRQLQALSTLTPRCVARTWQRCCRWVLGPWSGILKRVQEEEVHDQ
jgi:hypothetical protein